MMTHSHSDATASASSDMCPLFSVLGDDNLKHVLNYLDIPGLVRWDMTSKLSQSKSNDCWQKLCNGEVQAVSFAQSELQQFSDNSPKQQSILFYRASQFAQQQAERADQQHNQKAGTGTNDDEDGNNSNTQVLQPLPSNNAFDIQVFREPEAYMFFVRMTNKETEKDHDNVVKSDSTTSSSNSSNTGTVVLWEGFVHGIDQGSWGDSKILFFHMKELSATKIQWTTSMLELLNFNHQQYHSQADPVYENKQFHKIVEMAFQNFTFTMVAIPKQNYHNQQPPFRLVVASHGIHFVSHDNRIYYHIPSRRYDNTTTAPEEVNRQEEDNNNNNNEISENEVYSEESNKSHLQQHRIGDSALNTIDQSFIYPRLVTSETNPTTGQSGELLGIRLVCNRGINFIRHLQM